MSSETKAHAHANRTGGDEHTGGDGRTLGGERTGGERLHSPEKWTRDYRESQNQQANAPNSTDAWISDLNLEELTQTAQRYWSGVSEQASQVVRKHPLESLAVVLGVGLFTGVILSSGRK